MSVRKIGRVCCIAAIAGLLAGSFRPLLAADDDVQTRLRALEAENNLLKKTVEARDKEIADLKAKLEGGKGLVASPGAASQPATSHPAASAPASQAAVVVPAATTQAASGPSKSDPVLAVIDAIRVFTVNSRPLATDTDIGKRTRWINAAKKLEEALRKSPLTFTLTIDNVRADKEVVWVTSPSATLGSLDGPNVVFDHPVPIGLLITPQDAAKITKNSSMHIHGLFGLNVNYNQPPNVQPSFYQSRRTPDRTELANMVNFMISGTRVDLSAGAALGAGALCLVMRNGYTVEIDKQMKRPRNDDYLPPRPPQPTPPSGKH